MKINQAKNLLNKALCGITGKNQPKLTVPITKSFMIRYSVAGYTGAAQRVGTSNLLFYTISINKIAKHQGLMEKDFLTY